ncbi:hypothetical protein IV203_000623 [Nitzschia inconspicua]|uniref:Uncharacterized protein n=1 Tax=Nitzschia inconspicua TaxID=303405 RepID=A0A9K3L5P7_9STRA|nr:hypothetical protein IV203_000623 [Nitzschia inconspicua]
MKPVPRILDFQAIARVSSLFFSIFSFQDKLATYAFQQSTSVTRIIKCRQPSAIHVVTSRRSWIQDASILSLLLPVVSTSPSRANAFTEEQFDPEDPNNDPEIQELYNNPAIPPTPEERSGLVVLRVAEVAQFQEKILRAIVNGDLKGVTVSPMQFAFGTQILLRNSNLDGNMKLMINEEIPKKDRERAIKNAVKAMNTLLEIGKYSASIQRDFEPIEMVTLADMYLQVRVSLNELYEYLPQKRRTSITGILQLSQSMRRRLQTGRTIQISMGNWYLTSDMPST